MNIIIIGAMVEEIQYLCDVYDFNKINEINGQELFLLNGTTKKIYLLNSGIGKVNAAITLGMFLNTYDVDQIISIGSSGMLSEDLGIGTIVNGTELAYHDVDVSAFGYDVGKLPNNDKFFKTSQGEFFLNVLEKFKEYAKVEDGLILTGDQFVTSEQKIKIEQNFPHALAVEMESTAMVHTALAYKKEINVLRVISDSADKEATNDFSAFLEKVCIIYSKLLNIIIEEEL